MGKRGPLFQASVARTSIFEVRGSCCEIAANVPWRRNRRGGSVGNGNFSYSLGKSRGPQKRGSALRSLPTAVLFGEFVFACGLHSRHTIRGSLSRVGALSLQALELARTAGEAPLACCALEHPVLQGG